MINVIKRVNSTSHVIEDNPILKDFFIEFLKGYHVLNDSEEKFNKLDKDLKITFEKAVHKSFPGMYTSNRLGFNIKTKSEILRRTSFNVYNDKNGCGAMMIHGLMGYNNHESNLIPISAILNFVLIHMYPNVCLYINRGGKSSVLSYQSKGFKQILSYPNRHHNLFGTHNNDIQAICVYHIEEKYFRLYNNCISKLIDNGLTMTNKGAVYKDEEYKMSSPGNFFFSYINNTQDPLKDQKFKYLEDSQVKSINAHIKSHNENHDIKQIIVH